MIGAILYDCLVGGKARKPRALGAKLDSVCRSRAQWLLEQGSIGMIGVLLNDPLLGARLDQPMTMEQSSIVSDETTFNWVIWGKVNKFFIALLVSVNIS